MSFVHKSVNIPELETKTVDRKRFYLTPEGKMYPSITTVLQRRKMQGLMEWRKRVGDDVANYIARTAAQRGTKVHHMCEDLINNKAAGKIQLQQRVWNLFGKGEVFSKLITNDIIFKLMSKLLGSEFICGSYCASRLLPGSPGQELHIDYPYWDYYKSETFPMGLNSSFAQNCQATIPLDICSVESGATAYIPGSQKKLKYPNDKLRNVF